jgi:glycerol-3-phosphate acyltransferase PlsY
MVLPALLSSIEATGQELVLLPSAWIVVTLAYLVGAIPFGLLIAKRIAGIDLRTFGSGNIGATNAMRACGRGWGYAVFALDFLKGFGPVLACIWLIGRPDHRLLAQVLVGTASVLGHCYSIYLGFGGGKGVATGCGAIVAIAPVVFLWGGIAWLSTRGLTGWSGLASILMGLTFPLAVWIDGGPKALLVGATMLCFLIVLRHRSNIRRMWNGTEPRAGEKHGEKSAEKPTARQHG